MENTTSLSPVLIGELTLHDVREIHTELQDWEDVELELLAENLSLSVPQKDAMKYFLSDNFDYPPASDNNVFSAEVYKREFEDSDIRMKELSERIPILQQKSQDTSSDTEHDAIVQEIDGYKEELRLIRDFQSKLIDSLQERSVSQIIHTYPDSPENVHTPSAEIAYSERPILRVEIPGSETDQAVTYIREEPTMLTATYDTAEPIYTAMEADSPERLVPTNPFESPSTIIPALSDSVSELPDRNPSSSIPHSNLTPASSSILTPVNSPMSPYSASSILTPVVSDQMSPSVVSSVLTPVSNQMSAYPASSILTPVSDQIPPSVVSSILTPVSNQMSPYPTNAVLTPVSSQLLPFVEDDDEEDPKLELIDSKESHVIPTEEPVCFPLPLAYVITYCTRVHPRDIQTPSFWKSIGAMTKDLYPVSFPTNVTTASYTVYCGDLKNRLSALGKNDLTSLECIRADKQNEAYTLKNIDGDRRMRLLCTAILYGCMKGSKRGTKKVAEKKKPYDPWMSESNVDPMNPDVDDNFLASIADRDIRNSLTDGYVTHPALLKAMKKPCPSQIEIISYIQGKWRYVDYTPPEDVLWADLFDEKLGVSPIDRPWLFAYFVLESFPKEKDLLQIIRKMAKNNDRYNFSNEEYQPVKNVSAPWGKYRYVPEADLKFSTLL